MCIPLSQPELLFLMVDFIQRVLKYVPGAVGETDVPDTLPEFISQRRRWLNGSFFAATYAIAHAGQILRSGHSVGRKFALMCETVYNVINLIASWFAIVSPDNEKSHLT
jgi:chitin synthase